MVRVNFAEQPPSKQWLALKFRGVKFAEVWFKPEEEPWGLRFRIPQNSFHLPLIAKRLTLETLLKAVGLAPEEVESWRHGDVWDAAPEASDSQEENPLPQPPPDDPYQNIYVCLKQPAQVADDPESPDAEIAPLPTAGASENPDPEIAPPQIADSAKARDPETLLPEVAGLPAIRDSEIASLPAAAPDRDGPEIPESKMQDLESRWNAILGVESGIETLRLKMDGVRQELENCWSKTLTPEEKLFALKADVVQWTKAKARVHHSLPKIREFVHRATWIMGTPERKKLEELFKNYTEHSIPFLEADQAPEQLESLLKDRQVLSAQGLGVFHECKTIVGSIQTALTRLQLTAKARENKKKNAKKGGKFFKDVRRLTGAGD